MARHFGADGQAFTGSGWRFRCPSCAGWDFGPTLPLATYIGVWLHGGRLPGGSLGGGACLDCTHITNPSPVDVLPV
ncbi:hypothetical protein [Streptomyces anulatus]|uniref:hypothetical protein n=1 Tax=Streptomyces anulatus TaxID=1892 RepID=UPI001C2770FE|nr:hypothetical protein [Streptomyces anulatus]